MNQIPSTIKLLELSPSGFSDNDINTKISHLVKTRLLYHHLEKYNGDTNVNKICSLQNLFSPIHENRQNMFRGKTFEKIILGLERDLVISEEPQKRVFRKIRSNSLGESLDVLWDFNKFYALMNREMSKVIVF